MSSALILLGIYGCLIFVFFGIFVQSNEKDNAKLGTGTLFLCSILWPLALLIGIGRYLAQ